MMDIPEKQRMNLQFPVKALMVGIALITFSRAQAQLSVDAEINALHNQQFVSLALSHRFQNNFTLKLTGSYGNFGSQKAAAPRVEESVESPYTHHYYNSLTSYRSRNIGFAYGVGAGYMGRINAKHELHVEFLVQMYMVTDLFSYTPVSGFGSTKNWPEAAARVNHSNLSAGPSLSHLIHLNERFSVYYGFKLPYYMEFPFQTAFGTNSYDPENAIHVMAGIEPTVHAGIKYQLRK